MLKMGLQKSAALYGASILMFYRGETKDGKISEMDCGKNAPAWNSLKTVIV
jgi:hypothetical protein